jgi:uncharacterized delta-60 repeat protein
MSRSRIFSVAALAAVTVVVAPARTVDRAVGVQLRSSSHAGAQALAAQADGKLVAAGWSDAGGKFNRFALARYTNAGRLDPSFGRGGKIVTDFGSGSETSASDVAIQPDGKIVAVGSGLVGAGPSGFMLARYRKNGRLDASFGSGGKVLTSVGRRSGATAISIQRDGKLVVAGWSQAHVALVRYSRTGRLDKTFGHGGTVVTSWLAGAYGGRGYSLALQTDGKIVVTYARYARATGTRYGVARFDSDGTLDSTFGRGGVASVNGVEHSVEAIAIETDGKIVAAGSAPVGTDWGSRGTTANPGFAVTRLMSDGSVDTSFGDQGTALTDFTMAADTDKSAGIAALAIDPDGKLVAAGATDALDHRGDHPNTINDDVAVARYTPEGKLDASFGRRGKVITSFGDAGNWDTGASAVVIQSNGKIVVAGPRSLGAGDESHDFLLMRYTSQGRLDGTFGRGGKVLTDFGSR